VIRSLPGTCLPSVWMHCLWACRMTLKSRLKRAQPACGLGRQSLEKEQSSNHRGHGEARRPGFLDFFIVLCVLRRRSVRMVSVEGTPSGATFAVKLHPRARKNAITGELGDALKLSLTTPPVEGRANEACIAFLANLLNLPRSSVTIASGQNSGRKVIRVTGLSADEVHKRLRSQF
jgi:uncharacterized protein